jgi:hypothetical protein
VLEDEGPSEINLGRKQQITYLSRVEEGRPANRMYHNEWSLHLCHGGWQGSDCLVAYKDIYC